MPPPCKVLLLLVLLLSVDAFVPSRPVPRQSRTPPGVRRSRGSGQVQMVAEWRQYVPLVTSGLVILDVVSGIVTGNSVGNTVMSKLRDATMADLEAAEQGSMAPPPEVQMEGDRKVSSSQTLDDFAKSTTEEAERLLEATRKKMESPDRDDTIAKLNKIIDRELGVGSGGARDDW